MSESATGPTPAPGSGAQHLYDMRATHDMAHLRFASATGTWTVVRAVPHPRSGSATIIGAELEASTGALVYSSGAQASVTTGQVGLLEQGTWQLVANLSGANVPPQGDYAWTEPLPTFAHHLTAEDLYRPFAEGGVVVSDHTPGAPGSAQFKSVHLVPPGWEPRLQPTYDTVNQRAGFLVQPASATAADPAVQNLLTADNPLVATFAFRTVLESSAVDAGFVREHVSRAKGYQRSTFVYLTLLHLERLGPAGVAPELTAVVEQPSSVADDRFTALGIATARLLHPELPSAAAMAPALLNRVRDRSLTAAGAAAPDPYLQRLFETSRMT